MANTTWNPSDKTAGITLSGSNLVATCSTLTFQNVRAIDRQVSGKYYWEVTPTVATANIAVGVGNGASPIGSWSNVNTASTGAAFVNSTGVACINGTQVATGLGTFATGTPVCVALDLSLQLIWWRIGAAGNWNGSASNNPATGVGGYPVPFGATLAAYPLLTFQNPTNGTVQTANFGDSAFSGTVPSGFTAGFPSPSPAEIISLSAIAREALNASVGRANLAGIAREALLVGQGLAARGTARSAGQGSVNLTSAGLVLLGKITATSAARGATQGRLNLAGTARAASSGACYFLRHLVVSASGTATSRGKMLTVGQLNVAGRGKAQSSGSGLVYLNATGVIRQWGVVINTG